MQAFLKLLEQRATELTAEVARVRGTEQQERFLAENEGKCGHREGGPQGGGEGDWVGVGERHFSMSQLKRGAVWPLVATCGVLIIGSLCRAKQTKWC